MNAIRIAIAAVAAVYAVCIGWLAFAFSGYVADYGSPPAETLDFAIPWAKTSSR